MLLGRWVGGGCGGGGSKGTPTQFVEPGSICGTLDPVLII